MQREEHGARARAATVTAFTLLCFAAVISPACLGPTQVTLDLSTNVIRPGGRVAIYVGPTGTTESSTEPKAAVEQTAADGRLGTLVVVPSEDRRSGVSVKVVLGISRDPNECTRSSSSGCIVARRRTAFLPSTSFTLPIHLFAACEGVYCDDGTTCDADGRCIPADIDARACANEGRCSPVTTGVVVVDGSVGDGGPSSITTLAVGMQHACVARGGKLKCWGSNTDGSLGIGSTTPHGSGPNQMGAALPFVDLGTGRSVVSISANVDSNCALLDNARVKCWGLNFWGSLGTGDDAGRGAQPGEMGDALAHVDLGPGETVRHLGTGSTSTCAVLSGGQVKCWGYNGEGQLGLGDTRARGDNPGEMGAALPEVSLGTGARAVSTCGGQGFHCALLAGGAVKCWGGNSAGQLGQGDMTARGDQPGEMGDALRAIDLGTGRTARSIDCGAIHACAILDNGGLKCWGSGAAGQLGFSTDAQGDAPGEMGDALPYVDLGTGRTAKQVACGAVHTCALLDDGRVKCWGANEHGQLGLGDTISRGANGTMGDALPAVNLGTGRTALWINASGRAYAGNIASSCALLDNDQIKCWGNAEVGQLGLGDTTSRGTTASQMGDSLPAVDVGF